MYFSNCRGRSNGAFDVFARDIIQGASQSTQVPTPFLPVSPDPQVNF